MTNDHGEDDRDFQPLAGAGEVDLPYDFAPDPLDFRQDDAPARTRPLADQLAAVQAAIRTGTYADLLAASEKRT